MMCTGEIKDAKTIPAAAVRGLTHLFPASVQIVMRSAVGRRSRARSPRRMPRTPATGAATVYFVATDQKACPISAACMLDTLSSRGNKRAHRLQRSSKRLDVALS